MLRCFFRLYETNIALLGYKTSIINFCKGTPSYWLDMNILETAVANWEFEYSEYEDRIELKSIYELRFV